MYRLDGVDAEVRSYFEPVAKLVLSSRDPQEAMMVSARQCEGGAPGALLLPGVASLLLPAACSFMSSL